MTPPDRPAPQPAPDLDALLSRLGVHSSDYARDAYDAITSLRAQLAEAQAMSQKYQIAYGEEQDGRHREFNRANALKARVAELEAALREIAEHPHCIYTKPGDIYEIGVVDGHRCAATVAKNALKGGATT